MERNPWQEMSDHHKQDMKIWSRKSIITVIIGIICIICIICVPCHKCNKPSIKIENH